eukprot:COSAG01_NODE_33790_length_558_cov_1.651416_1_plen_72_part_10
MSGGYNGRGEGSPRYEAMHGHRRQGAAGNDASAGTGRGGGGGDRHAPSTTAPEGTRANPRQPAPSRGATGQR